MWNSVRHGLNPGLGHGQNGMSSQPSTILPPPSSNLNSIQDVYEILPLLQKQFPSLCSSNSGCAQPSCEQRGGHSGLRDKTHPGNGTHLTRKYFHSTNQGRLVCVPHSASLFRSIKPSFNSQDPGSGADVVVVGEEEAGAPVATSIPYIAASISLTRILPLLTKTQQPRISPSYIFNRNCNISFIN